MPAKKKPKTTKPYAITLSPFTGVTEVLIVRTADDTKIHQGLHFGGPDRALRIANGILDRETGIDTTAADLPAPVRQPVSLTKRRPTVNLRKAPRAH